MLPTRTDISNSRSGGRAAHGKRVFVGMSGGVDSSVSAALLKKAGYDVTGVFIKVWQPDWIECNWREERLEAMRAAAHLDIPFVTLDLEREYKEGVIDYMIREYEAGRTPNPDVMCNREVKFGAFWTWAEKQGADYIATGHYAQNEIGVDGQQHMLVSKDLNKDQTYFLWMLTQGDLEHALFPVGGMTKDEVRAAAQRFKLPNAEKKDSQGLCFIGKVDVKEFLAHYIKAKPGKVLNEAGKEIGEHPGALLFTIGERHGFIVTAKTPHDAPYYVVAKDIAANTITVSNRMAAPASHASSGSHCAIKRISWTAAPLKKGDRLQARTRYREQLLDVEVVDITVGKEGATAQIHFAKPHQTIAPGQSLVFYRESLAVAGHAGLECLGGGIIA
jgi:tRNA-specific 2-thiouridylase